MTYLFREFQEFRKILCVTPCCGNLVRVSDLKLAAKAPAARTWLDKYEKKESDLEKREERFEKREDKLKEIANQKGRRMAQRVFNNSISPSFRSMKLNPFDVKPILNPVDYVAFRGMERKKSVDDILFLSMKYSIPQLNALRKQVSSAVARKSYDIQVARIDDNGAIVME